MSNNQIGRDQRDYIRFRESDSYEEKKKEGDESFMGRFERENHDEFRSDYDPTYADEYGKKNPYEHVGKLNRWSDDVRSEASHNHRGKGPMGFKRSKTRIMEEACDLLSANSELDASGIEVEIKNECIILKGTVESRRDKKLAEFLVENISGVADVFNLLRINKGVLHEQ